MASISVKQGTPLANALSDVIQPKLVEVGWSSGSDDSALTEYIILMLHNNKTPEQISSELSTDLLSLSEDDSSAVDFTNWLFQQVDMLNSRLNPGPPAIADNASNPQNFHAGLSQDPNAMATDNAEHGAQVAQDDTMMGGDSASGSVPTGPKAMRNNNPHQRDKRMLGNINKSMERNGDSVLRRVRQTGGTGRINTHTREPPKGPRSQQIQRGLGMTGPGMGRGMPPMMPQGSMPFNGPPPNMMQFSPEQQMQMMGMFQDAARVMEQMFAGGPVVNPAFNNGMQNQQHGKSLFERVDKPRHNRSQRHENSSRPDVNMGEGEASGSGAAGAMDTETDPAQTVCRFNLACTKGDCPFQHQSPAAPQGVSIDMSDTCTFGAACMNHKCTGTHPSPAKRMEHKSTVDCKFFPNCTNPACPFKHPSMPACRNGADCTTPGCQFIHSKVKCRYTPCLNTMCQFKHEEGQKQAPLRNNVWTPGDKSKEHVSERKFVADEALEEELIIPGQGLDEAVETPINTEV